MNARTPSDLSEPSYITTGHLPDPVYVRLLVTEAHARFASNTDGPTSKADPALARVPSVSKPLTEERGVGPAVCQDALAAMATAGPYGTSGALHEQQLLPVQGPSGRL